MLKLPINTIEKAFNISIKSDYTVIGVDTASRTGICLAKSIGKHIILDYSFLDMSSKNKYHKYNTLIEYMNSNFNASAIDCVVIEETFFSRNAKAFQFLSRIGGMVYTVFYLKQVKDKQFISAVQARKTLGLPSIKKKEVVHKEFHKLIPNIKITDVDIIDAIILAINGLINKQGLLM